MTTPGNESIAYAMRNLEARAHFLNFNSPTQLLDWSFPAIELLMLAGALLALMHALRLTRQSAAPAALYTFVAIFLYGLVMDVSSYYTVGNFWHGEFSVMLVWNRLPLYIALFYPALVYHCYMTIRRYGFDPFTEAVSVGFYTGLLYLIFDNLGPALNWWIWDRASPVSQPLLDSVPISSYHWLFLFTAALAYCLRKLVWDALAAGRTARAKAGVALTPLLTMLLGSLLFIPFNVFAYAVPGGVWVAVAIHALSFFLAGYCFVLRYRRPSAPCDALLLLFPLVWLASHLYLYIAKHDKMFAVTADGLNVDGLAVGNLPAVAAGMVLGLAITLLSHSVVQK